MGRNGVTKDSGEVAGQIRAALTRRNIDSRVFVFVAQHLIDEQGAGQGRAQSNEPARFRSRRLAEIRSQALAWSPSTQEIAAGLLDKRGRPLL